MPQTTLDPRTASDALIGVLSRGARALPPGVAQRLGEQLGEMRRVCRPEDARSVSANLACLRIAGALRTGEGCLAAPGPPPPRGPHTTAAELVARTFRAFGLFVVEFFRGLALDPAQVAEGWRVIGWDHAASLAQARRGFILAGAHTGNWEQLGALGPLLGRRIVAPVETQFHARLSAAVKQAKQARGVISLPATAAWRELPRSLARGDLAALPLDGGVFRRGAPVQLLGARVRLATGAARLARLSGAPVLPVFSRRTGFMRQEVRIHAPLPAPRRDDREGEARLHQQLAELLGEQILRAPDQWCIFRPLAPGDS